MPKTTSISRTSIVPAIDGVLDESIWADAVIVDDLHQVQPTEYTPPSESTEFLLLYDADALYIGVRAHDSQPEQIRGKVLRQGANLDSEDRVKIMLDPFLDRRSGYEFQVNSNGVRLDGIYKGTGFDQDWDGIWQADAHRVSGGWNAEIRIPFKTLSFDDDSAWGFNASRELIRTNELIAWSSANRETDPAAGGTLTSLTDINQGWGLDIVPSLSSVVSRQYLPKGNDASIKPSLDIYYKITTGLNGSLTFNTDFSATEVDKRQLNLTRFSLFFPEKRSFFLRESDIFEFGDIGGDGAGDTVPRAEAENSRPFFSRRIGLSASGEPVDLNVGAKLSGRIGRWNVGALTIRQAAFENVNATDIMVARASLNVLQESSLGFMLTSGNPGSNQDNNLAGLDFQYRNSHLPGGRRVYANIWYQQTDTPGLNGDDAAIGISINAPNSEGWRGGLSAKEIQRNFFPAVGFVSRTDVRQYATNIGFTQQQADSWLQSLFAGVDLRWTESIGGELESQTTAFRLLELETSSRDIVNLRLNKNREILSLPFEISNGVVIPVGDYSFDSHSIRVNTSSDRLFTMRLKVELGDFYNGRKRSVTSAFGWRPSKYFTLKGAYSVDDVDLPNGRFQTRLASAGMDVSFSNKLSWVNLVQYDNLSNSIGLNSRIHWIPQAGRNLYLVANHNYQQRPDQRSFRSVRSELTLMFNYTFRF